MCNIDPPVDAMHDNIPHRRIGFIGADLEQEL